MWMILAVMGLMLLSKVDAPAQAVPPQHETQMPMPAASTPVPPAQMPMQPAQTPLSPDMSTMDMDPYFSTINYPVPRDTMMVMLLSDFQWARTGADFATGMVMVQYGLAPRWTVGLMAEGQKISGLPVTYGGFRINTYFRLFPHDHLLNFTLYGEYEDLNGAALYKMEVAGFGGEDLEEPLAQARSTSVRTFEQRAIVYHDWGRVNLTLNFISETPLQGGGNDFGYAWGVFRQTAYNVMGTDTGMAGMAGMAKAEAPPTFSFQRLGYGLEMIGALGNAGEFGFHWQRQQHYLGPVFRYSVSRRFTVQLAPSFGLSDVSDPFMLRMGIGYSVDHLLHRRPATP
jgi:hypothetical protein